MRKVLRHEITHAVDPKSKKLPIKGHTNIDDYYRNPKEFDAFGSNIAFAIRDTILKIPYGDNQRQSRKSRTGCVRVVLLQIYYQTSGIIFNNKRGSRTQSYGEYSNNDFST